MQHERAWRTFLERLPASIDDDGAQFVLTAVDVLELDPATRQRPHGLAVQQYLQPVAWLKSGLDADTDVDVAGIVAQVLACLGARNGEAPIGGELRRVGYLGSACRLAAGVDRRFPQFDFLAAVSTLIAEDDVARTVA